MERTSKFRELYARYLRGVQTSIRPDKLASSSHEVLWSLEQNAGSMERRHEYMIYGIQRLILEGKSKGYKKMHVHG